MSIVCKDRICFKDSNKYFKFAIFSISAVILFEALLE
jgi:glutaminase